MLSVLNLRREATKTFLNRNVKKRKKAFSRNTIAAALCSLA